MQERRKIALTSLLNNKICGYASCVLDLENHIRENAALVAAHRRGDRYAKKRLKGIVCGTPLEKSLVRNDQNFAPWGRGALRFLDFDKLPFATTPTQFVTSFFSKFAHIDGFEDCCVAEVSASGGCHIFAPALSDDAKADMLFYQRFADSPVDMSCANSSRVCLLTGERICLTSYMSLFTPVDERIVDELITMRDALEGTSDITEPQVVVEKSVPSVQSVVKESSDLEVYREIVSELLGGGQLPKRGTRNQTLYRHTVELMSLGLTDYEQLCEVFAGFDWYGLSPKEGKACVKSALKKEGAERSSSCREAVTKAIQKMPHTTVQLSNEVSVVIPVCESEHTDTLPEPVCDAATESKSASEGAVDAMEDFSPWQKHAPEMPEFKKLPPSVRTLLKPILKSNLHAHCLCMAEANLAALCHGTTFTDLVGDTRNLGSGWQVCGVAPSSSGKSSSWKPINAILEAAGLIEEDEMARKELDEWRKSERKRSTASTGSERPRNYSHLIGSSATLSGIVQRHADLEPGHTLLLNTSEISALDQIAQGEGKKLWLQNFDRDWLRCERSSSASDSYAIQLSMNVTTCCPPSVAQDWFRGEWLTGQISRWNLTTIIPDGEEESDDLYGDLTGYAESLKPYIARLAKIENQHLDVKPIRELVKQLRDDMLDYAVACGSNALKVLVRRASLRFYKCALLWHTLENRRMSPQLTDFLVWRWRFMIFSTFYTLGDIIEKEQRKDDEAGKAKQNGPINLLSFLPEEFDLAKLRALRVVRKFADNSDCALKNQLRTWKNRKLIAETDKPGVWRKCKK